MKLIDANTGAEILEQVPFRNVHGEHVVLKTVPGVFRAKAFVKTVGQPEPEWVRLHVRWSHPAFFLQHVAFFPS